MAKKTARRARATMQRRDIPLAKRLQMERADTIAAARNNAAKTIMLCIMCACHQVYGPSYKQLTRLVLRFRELDREVWEDIEIGMDHLKTRLATMGIDISGELYRYEKCCRKGEQELYDHVVQAAQVANLCGAVAMNDVLGYGEKRQGMIRERVSELAARYHREGDGFLLEEIRGMGFQVKDGQVIAYLGDDGEAVPVPGVAMAVGK